MLPEDAESRAREPLTPADSDLRGFTYMPLDVMRVRDSALMTLDGDAVKCNLMAWCVAWNQIPAASLPNDEKQLSFLLGFGKNLKKFRKIFELGGLHGFVLCGDGRLYHKVVAEKAREKWEKRSAYIQKMDGARAAKKTKNQGNPPYFPEAGAFEGGELNAIDVSMIEKKTPPIEPPPKSEHALIESKGEGEGESKREDKERKEEGSLRSPGARKATRLPEDWDPGDEGGEFARSLGLDARLTFPRFRDYWLGAPGQKGVKVDWPATWRNWCRREAEQGGGQRLLLNDNDRGQPSPGGLMGAAMRMYQRADDEGSDQ